jgi:dynein heavy chain
VLAQRLLGCLPRGQFATARASWSSQTRGAEARSTVAQTLVRRRLRLLGPALGRRAVVLIDDVLLPSADAWGARSALETLRTLLDQGGWHEPAQPGRPWMQVEDTAVLAVSAPAGGGRLAAGDRLDRFLPPLSRPSVAGLRGGADSLGPA